MPDYMFLLESRLTREQRAAVERVQQLAQASDVNLYLTGGAVRDLISGMPIRDLDFTVEGNPARMIRELEKAGAQVLDEDERNRHYELTYPGDVEGSITAAREEIYPEPGGKAEVRWGTVIEDLKRRDFSMNAIGISLNVASMGLLHDPTNGLADLERREVRALSIHSFTNQPIRMLRLVRFVVRMGFKVEPRTAEWFELALERGMHEKIEGPVLGREIRRLAREENIVGILKAWGARGLLEVLHPRLARRTPDYDRLKKLGKAVQGMTDAGGPAASSARPNMFVPVVHFLLDRLKARERTTALSRMGLRGKEVEAVTKLEAEARKMVKLIRSRKLAAPRAAYDYLETVSPDLLAYIQVRFSGGPAVNKIRTYIQRWKPLRRALPAVELELMGVPRGPQFDKIMDQFFSLQLAGKGRNPKDRTRLLQKLAGIKPERKKKIKAVEKAREKKAKAAAAAEAPPPRAPEPPRPAPAAKPPKRMKVARPPKKAAKRQAQPKAKKKAKSRGSRRKRR